MKRILFQGDSITDVFRDKEHNVHKGAGYATLVSAQLGVDKMGEYEFFNRGIIGNRVVDVLARVKCDIINLAPDYMSILLGVNDVRHEILNKDGISVEKFEKLYNMLIEEIREALPNIKLMILEPFLLKGIGTEDVWEEFRSEVEKRAQAAKRVAEKNNIVFIPLMKLFDEAAKKQPDTYWLYDGIHPTSAGHELIKREWIKHFELL